MNHVIFDIGSSSVGVAIVGGSFKNNEDNLLWSKRIEYTYNEEDYEHYVRTMYATLLEIGMKATGEGFKFVKEKNPSFSLKNADIVCVFSHPWFVSSIKECSQKSEKKFQVSETLVKKMKEKCLSKALNSQEVILWQEIMGNPVLFESYCDIVKLNGYQVVNFNNRLTNNLLMRFYFSFVSENVQEHVKEIVERVFPNHNISFFSSTYLFSHIYNFLLLNDRKHYVLVEIGGEVTTVSILKNAVIENVASMPLGTNIILKKMSSKDMSVKEAKDALIVLLKKVTDFDLLPKSLQKILTEWYSGIVKTIYVASGGVVPPSDVVVSVDGVLYPLFEILFHKSPSDVFENMDIATVNFNLRHARDYVFGDKKVLTDERLSTITYLLNNCTIKNGLCYNKNKI